MTGTALLASSYAIERELVSTDTGVVYEARDLRIDRRVAIKLGLREAGAASLLPEARRCAAVCDPCAVAIHGTGTHEGSEYVVAERVTGRLLGAELARGLAPDAYLARLRALVAAVARAHDAGIAIGDISGATVLVTHEQRLVLGTLSLSQVPTLGSHGRTLAPELVFDEVDRADPGAMQAIDLYSLGCVAIELASGARPFAAADLQRELRGHAADAPPRLTDLRDDLPTELSDLVDWLLAKHPPARPRSAADVLAQLDVIRERSRAGARTLRVLIVDDDTARARWLWSLVRRAHAGAVVEIAPDGAEAGYKLNRDHPDLVFVDAALRGIMNALEVCMYARGLGTDWRMYLLGTLSDRDRVLLEDVNVEILAEDPGLANAVLDRVRAAAAEIPRARPTRSRVNG